MTYLATDRLGTVDLRAARAHHRLQNATVAIVAALSLFAAVIGGWVLQSAIPADASPQVPAVFQQTHVEQARVDAHPRPASYADEDSASVDEQMFKSTRVKRDRPPTAMQLQSEAVGFRPRDPRFDGTDADIGLRDILTHFCVARR